MSALAKNKAKPTKFIKFEGKVKGAKSANGPVVIEGFANRFSKDEEILIDRGGDLIPPEAWMLDEFKTLPIIFFNHDRNQPVGKATMVTTTKDGLFIRVKISESDHPEIKRVRDLVKEGILRAFSVGFEPLEEEVKEVDGVEANMISKANLLEVSIVSLPMAQQSLFDALAKAQKKITTKALAALSIEEAIDVLTKQEEEPPEADEEEEGKQEEPSEEEEDQDKTGDSDDEDDNEKQEGTAISVTQEDPTDLGDPHLDLAKQTNVLLGQLIREIQQMNQRLYSLGAVDRRDQEESSTIEEDPTDLSDNIKTEIGRAHV